MFYLERGQIKCGLRDNASNHHHVTPNTDACSSVEDGEIEPAGTGVSAMRF
jgi:hypothetical protein